MSNKEQYNQGYVAGAKCALLHPGVPSLAGEQHNAHDRGWYRGYAATQDTMRQNRFGQFAAVCSVNV